MLRRDLSNAEQAALRTIVDAPVAWISPEELAKRMKLSLDEVSDLLVELDGEGKPESLHRVVWISTPH